MKRVLKKSTRKPTEAKRRRVSNNSELQDLRRKLEVEDALERIRARAMAMRGSAELADASSVLFFQLKKLRIKALRTSVGIFDDASDAMELWITAVSDNRKVIETLNYVNLHIHPVFENLIPARKQKKPFAVTSLTGNSLKQYYQHLSLPNLEKYNVKEFFYSFFFPLGTLNVVASESLSEEHCNILVRFAGVFGLIYTRFLDLQKAEEQTREARIESAIERVRSRSMAMRKSDELGEVAVMLYRELQSLGVEHFFNCGFVEVDTDHKIQHGWMTQPDGSQIQGFNLPLTGDPVLQERFEAWQRQDPIFYQSVGGAELKKHLAFVTPHIASQVVDKVTNQLPDPTVFYAFNFSHGYLHIVSDSLLNADAESLAARFTRVFEIAYRRFLDLKLAEEQTREAQIETSLERVRSKAMAMHSSDDLAEAAGAVFTELKKLGINPMRSGFVLLTKESRRAKLYPATALNEQETRSFTGEFDFVGHPIFEKQYESWTKGENYFPEMSGEVMKSYYRILSEGLKVSPKTFVAGGKQFGSFLPFSEGFLFTWSEQPYSDKEVTVLGRFKSILDLTIRRYLDIKKAEAQAREAQIEAAMERVRSRSLAMHKSDELEEVVAILYKQFEELDFGLFQILVSIYDPEKNIIEWWSKGFGRDLPQRNIIPIIDHDFSNDLFDKWRSGIEYYPHILEGELKRSWETYLFTQTDLKHFPPQVKDAMQSLERVYLSDAFMKHGSLQAAGPSPLPETKAIVLRRFAKVLDQAYTRMQDLQTAEAQALQAIKQAALDRVRAEIAAMRTTTDLQRITPLVWRELKTLGVPFFRCGVLIMDESEQKLNYYLSTPEGRPLAALHLDFKTNLTVVRNALDHWRQQKTYIDHWTRDEFLAFAQEMIRLGQIETVKSYQGGEQTPESITLQFVPFAQGMLYVGSAENLTTDQIELVHALADAFSTAYARYEDFVRLELAKEQVELTLSDLRSTQNQLVQSEKMASLGELTAGIAHEIQNPLNFVNNFSEVSKELLDEMKQELAQGNADSAKAIAQSVAENLDKIFFHGKRADGIVKSMLQHSRKSSGQKELTDINALCDEYLRLAYHGLRAKDKSFNAKFDLDLDSTVSKINVMPQEIGRVVLNLINNAFYAVSEKKQHKQDGYEPTVIVSTKKSEAIIEIRVRDNGAGIPEKIREKIFQPFFTTKPTGQGTGLGLSLSYDIIKSHGGKLSLESQEGIGTTAIIELPL